MGLVTGLPIMFVMDIITMMLAILLYNGILFNPDKLGSGREILYIEGQLVAFCFGCCTR